MRGRGEHPGTEVHHQVEPVLQPMRPATVTVAIGSGCGGTLVVKECTRPTHKGCAGMARSMFRSRT